MANLLDPNEIMFRNFEPKLKMRFIMYVDGIPSYLIKTSGRPVVETAEVVLPHINIERYVKGKSKWTEITITLYDPIVPSGAQSVMEWFRTTHESVTGRDGYSDFYKKDVVINVLGPVGDKVEEWTLKGAWPKSVTPSDLDWSDESTALDVSVVLRYDFAILQY
jgi:hypothetical protein